MEISDLYFYAMSWIVVGGVMVSGMGTNGLIDRAQRRYLDRHGSLAPIWYENLALLIAVLIWPALLVVLAVKVAKAVRR
jgi:hypothetical protein